MSGSFVGRRVELAQLEAVCSDAKTYARPAAALISGAPGSGKSSLLAVLRGRQQGMHHLKLVGYQAGTQVSLAAAGDLLRALGKVPGAGELLSEFLFGPKPTDDRWIEPLRLF